ncbi:hypothetical protein P7K49_012922, partial [Saguinus oedipus]
ATIPVLLDCKLAEGTPKPPRTLLSAQAAALAVCQCLAVESTHPLSPGFEDCSSSEATTPVAVQHIRPARVKRRKQSPVPALPIVVQLMEMGFPRRNIEFALKSLTGASGNASGLPGTWFSWSLFVCLWVPASVLCAHGGLWCALCAHGGLWYAVCSRQPVVCCVAHGGLWCALGLTAACGVQCGTRWPVVCYVAHGGLWYAVAHGGPWCAVRVCAYDGLWCAVWLTVACGVLWLMVACGVLCG